jgi:hypothetical protein
MINYVPKYVIFAFGSYIKLDVLKFKILLRSWPIYIRIIGLKSKSCSLSPESKIAHVRLFETGVILLVLRHLSKVS